jgi:hypothetical protein
MKNNCCKNKNLNKRTTTISCIGKQLAMITNTEKQLDNLMSKLLLLIIMSQQKKIRYKVQQIKVMKILLQQKIKGLSLVEI